MDRPAKPPDAPRVMRPSTSEKIAFYSLFTVVFAMGFAFIGYAIYGLIGSIFWW